MRKVTARDTWKEKETQIERKLYTRSTHREGKRTFLLLFDGLQLRLNAGAEVLRVLVLGI